jgi:hypothetical protein
MARSDAETRGRASNSARLEADRRGVAAGYGPAPGEAGTDTFAVRLAELEVLSAARINELLAPGQVLLRLAVSGFGIRLPLGRETPWPWPWAAGDHP